MEIFKLPVGLMLALSFFTTAVIPQGVQASVLEEYKMQFTSHEQQVAEAFDRFHFAMAVEWDQQDLNFKEAAQKNLEKTLLNLMKAGVTAQEIQKAMEKSILQGKAQADYKRLVEALKSQDMTEEEAVHLAMDFMDKNYHEGTNFAGEGPHHGKWKVIAAIIVVVVIICCVKGMKRDHDDRDKEEKPDCAYGYGRSGDYCYPIRD